MKLSVVIPNSWVSMSIEAGKRAPHKIKTPDRSVALNLKAEVSHWDTAASSSNFFEMCVF